MSKLLYFFIILFLFSACSLNKNSKFWTNTKNIDSENDSIYEELFPAEKTLKEEFNSNLKIKLDNKTAVKWINNDLLNNSFRINFNSNLENSSRYKFSKIDDFIQYQPDISFHQNNLIFFDNKGSLLKFDSESKLIWKKNYYSKSEKKLNPILQLINNGKYLIVADNITKYYMVDIETGNLIWSKTNLAPFNSQIKIYKDKFFIIDFTNTLRCFSLKNGKELWNIPTEKSLIRSQKKLSMIIVDGKLYFNNSLGDITAVEINKGELLWQLPTQSNLIYESSFSLEASELISNKKKLFFSNNRNELFSIDIKTGTINWINKINSNLKSILVDNYLVSISLEGYLIITEKNSGNIVRVTDVFKGFKKNKRPYIKPTGFIVGLNKIYLSTSNGRLLVIDISSGEIISVLKIDSEKISKPFVQDANLFLIKDNAIIKLN